jgi:hypothetical protein
MHQQFDIQQLYALPTPYLSENKQRLVSHHKLIGFCKLVEKCLQRGTDWVFKYSGLRFVFKGLIQKMNQRRSSDLYWYQQF